MESYSPPPIPSPTYTQPAPRKRRVWPWVLGLGALGLILLLAVSFFAAMANTINSSGAFAGHSHKVQSQIIQEGGSDRIAHIDLDGVITASASQGSSSMVEDFGLLMKTAVEDSSVKAIVVRINSPGGEVTASDRLHQIILQADKTKPVIAYLDTIAASGGYYAACGTRHIIAHPTTFTGSIGVIIQSVKYGELFDKMGVAMEVYKSGELKDLLSGTRPTSPEEAKLVNDLIQETYTRFLGIVAANRKKTIDELRASPLTDGRIFSGTQALAAGMVDQNGFIEDAYEHAMKLAGVSGATVIRYTPQLSFFDAFSAFGSAKDATKRVELDVSDRLLPRIQNGVPLYLHLDGY